jgi:hypothetical protein
MKKIIYLLVVVSFICLNACKPNQEEASRQASSKSPSSPTDKEMEAIGRSMAEMESESEVLWYPEQTTIDSSPGKVIITPPSTYVYVGVDSLTGQVVVEKRNLVITCDCKIGGSCNPTSNGNSYACVSSDCNKCIMTVRRGSSAFKMGSGFVKGSYEVRILAKEEVLPGAFAAMFEVEDLKRNFDSFMLNYYPSIGAIPNFIEKDGAFIAPNGYTIVMLDVAGRAAPVLLPNSAVDTSTQATGGSASCRCNKAGGGCVPARSGASITCSANGCKSCSLLLKEEEAPGLIGSEVDPLYGYTNYAY